MEVQHRSYRIVSAPESVIRNWREICEGGYEGDDTVSGDDTVFLDGTLELASNVVVDNPDENGLGTVRIAVFEVDYGSVKEGREYSEREVFTFLMSDGSFEMMMNMEEVLALTRRERASVTFFGTDAADADILADEKAGH